MTVTEDENTWVETAFSEQVSLCAERLDGMVKAINALLGNGTLAIEAERIHFASGQDLIGYAEETKTALSAGMIDQ